jgi:hypothetical protein
MNILRATESHFKSLADKNAFEINQIVQNLADENSVEALARSIKNYNQAISGLQTLSNISSQAKTDQNTPEEPDEG